MIDMRHMSEMETVRLFGAFDNALQAVNPVTGVLWNTPATVNDELRREPLQAAYAEIEKHNLRVAHVFMNHRDYSDIRKFGREQIPAVTGVVACLWEAEIIVARAATEGTIYVCAAEEHIHLIEGPSVYDIKNPWTVASITIKRDDSNNQTQLKTNRTDNNLRGVFG